MQAVSEPIVNARGVSKTFREGTLQVEVLKGIDFQVGQGELVSIVGASGSGKTTLLHILGGLAEPSSGTVHIDQKDINRLSQKARGDLRNHALGFVYQFHHLLAEFSAQENVAMPLLIRRTDPEQAMEQAADILVRVGLGERLGHRPAELSGGERQRAALARALVAKPRCIMADEPTGNLDARTAGSIHDLLVELNEATGTSLIVVTHDIRLAERMGRMVSLENGRITDR
ncbi:MAG: lipoprotein-releasing ABC transporter ATP-binding protein LolD [Gammaproteobacteria bacterium]|nr:lipoprotein-releasing ABC transporter ATP-binding protein LolD [Gammaproteobacteria bacterium]MDE0714218.1 lipoprotein-releasing ABC transporter ATP-binding protein LolD [Gammaproteobacteria bacterium]MXY64870.1 lipoprotein-releasing ABC transporter ATP-binding protein LolD [Gammaproteobacteria bacterium]MYG65419.1 lipoprotein-releasing ABC transporter ATP-binding protein LolD [Gammaproteobacteria bacterium]